MKFTAFAVLSTLSLVEGNWNPYETYPVVDYDGPATYQPGNFDWGYYIRDKDGKRVRVSNGVTGRPIALAGEPIPYADGSFSDAVLHRRNDGGAVIPKEDGSGFYYVSNSEAGDWEDGEYDGGVYTFSLNENHEVIDYYPVLLGTVDNCAGGATPWGTWVSCEEEDGYGECWQVDPANKEMRGPTRPRRTFLTQYPGNWEAFAWDDSDSPPRGYVTDDAEPEDAPESYGVLLRFTPDETGLDCYNGETKEERWCTLNHGTRDFLKVNPPAGGGNCGTIEWVERIAQSNPEYFRKGEGIDVQPDGMMRFIAKEDQLLFEIDLRAETYCQYSTLEGFPQQGDNIRYWKNALYICTDGISPNGVIARDDNGYFQVVIEMDYDTEAAGVDFSPDGKFMYVSFQDKALWQFWRQDGRAWEEPGASAPKYVNNNSLIYSAGIKLDSFIDETEDKIDEIEDKLKGSA